MSGSRPTVGIRVTAEGAEQARRQLEAIGPAGDAALRRVATASAAATPELQRLAQASDVAQRSFTGMGGSLGRLGGVISGVSGVASVAATGLVAMGAAGALGLAQIARAGDAATATMARLTSATGSLAQAQTVYEGLFRLSQQTGVAVADSAGAFGRFAVAAKEIGGTNDQVLKLVSGIQKAGIVSGGSAQEIGAAVQQLGQALASGRLQGDELRSLLENMPQLAAALARELGVGIGQMREMGSEGKLTADTVFPALLRASEKMSAEFDKMPVTMSRAFGILGAGMKDFADRLDKALGLSQAIAKAVKAAADAVGAVGRYVAPTEAEANAQAIARLEERRDRLRAEATPDRQQFPDGAAGDRLFAAASANANQQAAEQYRAAEAELAGHYQRRFEIQLAAETRAQVEEMEALRKAREAAQVSATIRLRDTAADLDARYKARKAYEEKIKKLDEDQAKGGTLPAGVTFDALRKAALDDYNDALKKVADSENKAGAAAEKAGNATRRAAETRADVIEKLGLQIAAQKAALAAAQSGTAASRDAAIALETESRIRAAGIPDIEKRTAAQKRDADEIARSVAELDRLKQATKESEEAAKKARDWHQRSWNEVANIGERAFDRLGDAIVDAFVSGQGAAVNFGNVARGILASVVSDIAKLGVVNPILNSLFTGSNGLRPTLGGAGLGDLLGMGNLFGGGGLSQYLFGSAAPLQGPTISGAPLGGAAGLLGSGGNLFGIPGIGGLLQGAGLGAGIGGLTAGLLGGNSTYGSLGGAAGALLGQMLVPVPGVGALLGGLLGGAGGGLIGPKESVKGWSYAIRSDGEGLGAGVGGQIKMTDVFYNESGKAQFDAANQSIAALNAFLAEQGLTVQGARAVGGNKNGPDASWGGAASFGDALADLRFGSSKDTRLDAYLSGKSFDDPAKLAEAVQGFTAAAAAIDALGAEAVPAFTASLKAVNDNFDAGGEQAKKYGLAEDNLTTARARAIEALEAQRTETLRQSDVSLAIRRLAAAGSTQDAELARQAEAARQEIEAFGRSLDALAINAEDKALRLIALEEVQAAERAAIIARYGEQAAQALRQAGGSIRAWLDNLASGTTAGASPADRLAAAQAAFDRDRTLSLGGDRDALGRITGSADALLSAGRDNYASGAGFQAILAQVTGGLSSLPVVASYDAMMAGSLTAIQAAIENGTLNTATTILPSGNIVQLAGGLSLGGVEAALAAIEGELAAGNGMVSANLGAANAHLYAANEIAVAQHASIVAAHASAVALHATQVAMHQSIVALHQTAVAVEGGIYTAASLLGAQLAAVNDNLVAGNQIGVDGAVGIHAAIGAGNTIAADASAAVMAALGLGNSIASTASGHQFQTASRLSIVSNTLAAANNYHIANGQRIDAANKIAADAAAGIVASLSALSTISVDASAAATRSLAAMNTILVDSSAAATTGQALANTIAGKINADTAAIRAYASFIDNTLKATSNYTLDLRARLDGGNAIAAAAAASAAAGIAALNTITVDASAAATNSLAALNTILVDSSAAATTGQALANTIAGKINADTAAIRAYASFIDNTLKATSNYTLDLRARLDGGNAIAAAAAASAAAGIAALNTITVDASAAATNSLAAMNTILVDSSAASTASLALANTIAARIGADTGAIRSYASIGNNTLQAANNYAIEQTTELRGLRQQVNELRSALVTLTATVQAAGIATATEARAAGLLVADRVEQVDSTLRKAA